MVVTSILVYLDASQFGIGTATSSVVAKTVQRREQRAVLSSSFILLCISSLVFLILTVLAAAVPHLWLPLFGDIPGYLQDEAIKATILLAAIFLIRLPTIAFISIFVGLQRLHWERLYSRILPALVSIGALLLTIYLKGSLVMLAAMTGLGHFLVGIASVLHIVLLYKDLRPMWMKGLLRGPYARQIVASGWRFFVIGIAAMIVWSTDNLVISYSLGPDHVSAYAVTFTLFKGAFSMFSIVNSSLWPMYGRTAGEDNWEWISRIYGYAIAVLPILGGMVWIGGIAFAEDIIRLWTGQAGYGGALVVFALGGYGYTVSLNNTHANLLGGINETRGTVWIGVLEAAVNLGLSLILVRFLEAGGVALGTFLSALLTVTWLLPIYVSRQTQGKISLNSQLTLRHAILAIVPSVTTVLIINSYMTKGWLELLLKALLIVIYLGISWKMVPFESRSHLIHDIRKWKGLPI